MSTLLIRHHLRCLQPIIWYDRLFPFLTALFFPTLGKEKIKLQQEIIEHPRTALTDQPPMELFQDSKRSMDAARTQAEKILVAQEATLAQRFAETEETHRSLNWAIALILFLGVVGAAVAVTLFAAGISRRIDQLRNSAIDYGKGKGNLVPPRGRDEIGELGRSLEEMAHALSIREGELIRARERAEILNAELDRQLLMANTANKELEAFSYSVSHDLRAPLRHVAGFSELMANNSASLDEKNKRYLGIIAASIKQMGQLIDDLLEFSRMGRTALKRESIDLNEMVTAVRSEMASDLEGRDIEWNMQPLPTVHGDPAMIKLVVQNLVNNAVKYTRKRDHAIINIVPSGSLQAGELGMQITDNGAGFDMQYIDKLFGVFQRLHGNEEFEGTGIGLATARRIITRHGGRVEAVASLDAGATFTIYLPTSWKEESS